MLQRLQSLEGAENRFTELGKAYEAALQAPSIKITSQGTKDLDSSADTAHEASYDAYMTGAVFANSLHKLDCLRAALKLGDSAPQVVKKKRGRPPKNPPKVEPNLEASVSRIDPKSWSSVMDWISNKYPLGGLGVPFEIVTHNSYQHGGSGTGSAAEPNEESLEDKASIYAKLVNLSDPSKSVPVTTLKDILETKFVSGEATGEPSVIVYQIFSDNAEVCFTSKQKEQFTAMLELIDSFGGEYQGRICCEKK